MRTLTHKKTTVFAAACCLAIAVAVGSLATGSAAQTQSDGPDINSPQQEMDTFTVADGYSVNVFAAEPDVVNPIAMQFDGKGRLWVVNTPTYPQVRPGEEPICNIVILEDTNGDGQADKSTTFADGLLLPTGLALGEGGAYIAHGTEVLHLADTTGDDRADRRRVVLTGFGAGDSHTNINNLQWAPDGSLTMSAGLHTHHSRIATPQGVTYGHRDGHWRYRPRTRQTEAFLGETTAGNNPWGTTFDRWGQPFYVNGPGRGVLWLKPGMTASPGQQVIDAVIPHHHLCGADFIDGDHLPPDARGRIVAGGYRHNELVWFNLEENGSGFGGGLAEQPLIRSTSETFRPIDVKLGPDGAIYVVDFTQIIIGHYEFSLRDPRRDHRHGRIWRIEANDRPLVQGRDFTAMEVDALIERLQADFSYDRYQARRALSERDSDTVTAAIRDWAASLDETDAAHAPHFFEALGVLADHEHVDAALLHRALASPQPRLREFATGLVALWHDRLDDPAGILESMAADDHPRVRLEAVVASSHLDHPHAWDIVQQVRAGDTDRFLEYAIMQATAALEDHRDVDPALADAEPDAAQVQQQQQAQAAKIYASCTACHGGQGQGIPDLGNALAGSEWVQGDPEALVRILLHGYEGEADDTAAPTHIMPPHSHLADQDLAAVLTYIRQSFGNDANPITTEQVGQIRQDTADRARTWTADELRELLD